MARYIALFAALCCALPALWAAPGVPARDVLRNGGFEDGTAGWEPDAGHTLIEDRAAAFEGTRCLSGEVTEPSRALTLKQTVTVRSRNLYEFEIRARATNRTKLVLWAVFPGEDARRMVTAWENVPAKWTRFSVPVSPAADGPLELHVIAPSSHGAPAGRIWIDNVALRETEMPESRSLSEGQGFNDEPCLTLGRDGALYAAWISYAGGRDSIRAARYENAADGALQRTGIWTAVAPGPRTFILGPALAAAPGGAALAYAAEVNDGNWDVFLLPLGRSGPGEPVAVGTGPGTDIKPSIAAAGDDLWVAWESNPDGQRSIAAVRVRDGRPGEPLRVSTAAGSNYAPSLAVPEGGQPAIAWHAFRDGNYDIYLRRLDRGGSWGEETRVTSAPTIDRHARLFARGAELWLAYENAESSGYRIGTTPKRVLSVVRIGPDGSLSAPEGFSESSLTERCEGVTPVADAVGRIWFPHLRPRGRREGWDVFAVGYTGAEWTPLRRLSGALGFDRAPAAVVAGSRLIVASQVQPALRRYEERPSEEEVPGDIFLSVADLSGEPPAAALRTVPFSESEVPFEAAELQRTHGDLPRGDRPTIEYKGQTYTLVYGDLHEHTDVSQCNRLGDQSIDESYQHMRDISALDFAAATDHGYNITPYLWNYTAKLARVNDDPGRFITFLGEEWTSTFEDVTDKNPYGYYGHRNLILADAYFPRWWNAQNRQTPAELWSELRAMKANFVNIPHQIADTGNVPTDWDFADEEAQPVAEIFQVRGSYEYKGAPREAPRSTPAGWFIQDAWARGLVIGVIASPDHGGGIGKACVYTPALTREAILDSLRARRCFGSTAARMMIDFRVNGALMGEKIPAADGQPVALSVSVSCPAEIDRVEICRNNEFIYSRSPQAASAEFEFRDPNPVPGRSYYYVRVLQTNGEIGWSSPVWLGYE